MTQQREAVLESVSASLRSVWWIPLLRGLILLSLGVLVMVEPLNTLTTLALIMGIFLIVDGFVSILNGWAHRRQTGWKVWLIQGLIDFAFAAMILFWPSITIVVFFYLIVIWAVALGAVAIVGASLLAKTKSLMWPWLLSFGLLSVMFGVMLLLKSGTALAQQANIIGLVIGLYALMLGALQIVSAFSVRGVARDIDNALKGQSEVLEAFNKSEVRYAEQQAERAAERQALREEQKAEREAEKLAQKAEKQAEREAEKQLKEAEAELGSPVIDVPATDRTVADGFVVEETTVAEVVESPLEIGEPNPLHVPVLKDSGETNGQSALDAQLPQDGELPQEGRLPQDSQFPKE